MHNESIVNGDHLKFCFVKGVCSLLNRLHQTRLRFAKWTCMVRTKFVITSLSVLLKSCSYAAWQQVSGCCMNSNKLLKEIAILWKNMLKSTKYSVILNLQIRLSIWQNCLNRNLKFIKEHFVTIFKLGNYSKIKAAFLESMLISKTI